MNGLKLIKYNVLKMVFLHSKENTLLLLMCDSVAWVSAAAVVPKNQKAV